ncbi:hypothetical protein IEI94_08780 [Halomonas sp. ML-15]|uniref:hypothetical protein n=1 Tax=Halomonas sp. ML-15 TaxID=2773305 RepID=UPI001745CF9E|nr:hypothetical protein [Halomonas sp. ML-15]MBD3895942.1 hypothetical protein [Halomonas sp. ML-15]
MSEFFNLGSWKPEWVQAISSIVAVSVALAMPFILDFRRRRRERDAAQERETVALQAIYPEIHQLQTFFLATELHVAREEYDELMKIAEGASDVDPSVPHSIADGRFDIVTYLSSGLVGSYSIALARRKTVLTSLSAILNRERYVTVESGISRFDFEKASDSMLLIKSLCSQGVGACGEIIDEAEKRDASLRVVGVKNRTPQHNR